MQIFTARMERTCIEEMKHCCDKIKIVGSYNNLNDYSMEAKE